MVFHSGGRSRWWSQFVEVVVDTVGEDIEVAVDTVATAGKLVVEDIVQEPSQALS